MKRGGHCLTLSLGHVICFEQATIALSPSAAGSAGQSLGPAAIYLRHGVSACSLRKQFAYVCRAHAEFEMVISNVSAFYRTNADITHFAGDAESMRQM
jgi:hypothetical protein